MLQITLLVYVIIMIVDYSSSYPWGVPVDVCDMLSPTRAHELSLFTNNSPYILLQTAIAYKPGQVINVSIVRLHYESRFEGFIVQAVDKVNGRPIGRFLDAEGLNLLDECSAVTHKNRNKKASVHLAWVAPMQQRGDVAFRGTIVEEKSKYYEVTSRLEPSRNNKLL